MPETIDGTIRQPSYHVTQATVLHWHRPSLTVTGNRMKLTNRELEFSNLNLNLSLCLRIKIATVGELYHDSSHVDLKWNSRNSDHFEIQQNRDR